MQEMKLSHANEMASRKEAGGKLQQSFADLQKKLDRRQKQEREDSQTKIHQINEHHAEKLTELVEKMQGKKIRASPHK